MQLATVVFNVASYPTTRPPVDASPQEMARGFAERATTVEIGSTINARAGTLIYVPKGNPHAHVNVAEGMGRMLVSQTPGGLYERFFEEIGEETMNEPAASASGNLTDMQGTARVAAEHGIEIPRPGRPRDRQEGSTDKHVRILDFTGARGSPGKGKKGEGSMFARMFTIDGRRERVDEFAHAGKEKVLPALQRLDGFGGLVILANHQNDKILVVTLWENEEAMLGSEEAAYWFRVFSAEVAGGHATAVERYEVVFSENGG